MAHCLGKILRKGFKGGVKGLKKLLRRDLRKILAREAIQKALDLYKSAAGRVKNKRLNKTFNYANMGVDLAVGYVYENFNI